MRLCWALGVLAALLSTAQVRCMRIALAGLAFRRLDGVSEAAQSVYHTHLGV